MELREITKSFGGSRVLDGASLCCAPGEITCLIGANAAGKTTLLTIAAGLQQPDSGLVTRPGRLGFVPQDSALLEELTVAENLRLWYAAAGLPAAGMFAEDSTEALLGLASFARKRVCKLSGGIKKRTAIACALACDPACLLMDEPFAALDLPSRREITALLKRLKGAGKVILFSSHDPAAIADTAHCVALLREGKIASVTMLEQGDAPPTLQVLSLLAQV